MTLILRRFSISHVIVTYKYDAWGNCTIGTDTTSYLCSIDKINLFRYCGYFYEYETGLYYLNFRYYDPQTGRFINADAYIDTQSGTPLSTNMFAYCENNAVSGYDPNGNWDWKDHEKMTKNAGFSSLVYQTAGSADSYPFGNAKNKYSAPFHSRPESLSIAKKLYNLALDIKVNKKTKKFVIGKSETGCTRVDFLKYNPKDTKSDTAKSDTARAQKDFLNEINVKNNNWKKQYQIILGLALHTIQDYFAHCIRVYSLMEGENSNSVKEKIAKGSYAMTTVNYWITPSQNMQIEDNINFLNWRYRTAEGITSSIYTYFTKGWAIKEIESNNLYTSTSKFYVRWPNSMKKGQYGVYTTKRPKNNYYYYKITTGHVVLIFTFKK